MNILQICYKYPPFYSGYGMQLRTINKEILSENHNIQITIISAYGNRTRKNNLKIKTLFKKQPKKNLVSYSSFCFISPIVFFVDYLRADVIHIVKAGPESILPIVIGKLFRKKILIKVAGNDIEKIIPRKSSILRRLRRHLLRKVDYAVAVSKKIERDYLQINLTEGQIKKIPNGVDTNRFHLQEKIPNKNRNSITNFLFVGSIRKNKGIIELLDALNTYNGIKIEVTFIGEILDILDFKYRIKKLNKKSNLNITYIPYTQQPEKYMQQNDCLILPSHSEGMPNVVLEALCCGLFLILSDIPVHREIHTNFNSILFSATDKYSLLSAIEKGTQKHYPLKDRIKQSKLAIKKFSSKNIANKYIKLYK